MVVVVVVVVSQFWSPQRRRFGAPFGNGADSVTPPARSCDRIFGGARRTQPVPLSGRADGSPWEFPQRRVQVTRALKNHAIGPRTEGTYRKTWVSTRKGGNS